MTRRICLATAAVALVGALAAPAGAGGRCKPFKPHLHESQSGKHADAAAAEVLVVTAKATEKKPLTVSYVHGPGVDPGSGFDVVVADAAFFNIQVQTKKRTAALNVRTEWPAPSPQDIELFMYDQRGYQVAQSASFNAVPELHNEGGDDGNGWEQISGHPVRTCDGFTIESQGGITVRTDVTLKVWLE